MNIVIAGGSGFIGKKLTALLQAENHQVYILTRSEGKIKNGVVFVKWLSEDATPEQHLKDIDAFINLAGVSLNDGRWTDEQKQKILQSRIETTTECLRIIQALPTKPRVFINSSAVGIYPISKTAIYTEQSLEKADDFLGTVVQAWEQKASDIAALGIRTCYTRLGVVLGNGEGALPMMVLPYKLFAGGTIGNGEQWLSWIHIDDVCRAIAYLLEDESIEGPVNFTSPNPKRMKTFGKIIGYVLKRPHWLPVPSSALKLALGEKSVLILEGQYVLPEKLLASNFKFKYSSLAEALENLLT